MSEGGGERQGGRGLGPWLAWFWTGLVVFGVVGVVSLFLSGAFAGQQLWPLALIVIVVTAGLGLWAFRAGNIPLASGMFAGYAVATVFSGGQCTFWSATADYGFLNGAFVYLFVVAGALVAALIGAGIDYARKNTGSP